MRLGLKVSLGVNAVFAAALILFLFAPVRYPAGNDLRHAGISDVLEIPSPVVSIREKFSWRRLESDDYRTFVANLRGIECPEQTIEDIICADVHALFARKRLEKDSFSLADSEKWSTNEEHNVVAAILGRSPNRLDPAPTAQPPVYPLVFSQIDFSLFPLDSEQSAAVEELRQEFQEKVGLHLDRADPAYAQKWREAQPENDALLRGMIGVNAFMQYQNETR
jgi:hypothetical protein